MSASRPPLSIPVALLIIVIASFTAFAPVLNADFTSWDDYETVGRNPLLIPPTMRSLAPLVVGIDARF